MSVKEVDTSLGKFKIRTPLAGERNKALIAAEGENGKIKQFVFLTELLPFCIAESPFDPKKNVRDCVNGMEPSEYDKLAAALGKLLKSNIKDAENDIKKSSGLSEKEKLQTSKQA